MKTRLLKKLRNKFRKNNRIIKLSNYKYIYQYFDKDSMDWNDHTEGDLIETIKSYKLDERRFMKNWIRCHKKKYVERVKI